MRSEEMATRRAFGKQALGVAGWAAARAAGFAAPPGQVAAGVSLAESFTGAGSLRAHALVRQMYVGAAVNVARLDKDPAYARTVAEQYNVLVAENAMKWAALRPGPERFDFTVADRLMAFAASHGMAVRGHNLCWYQALPAWFAASVTPANAEQVLKQHIATVVGRYKERIRAWDVVNEAIEPKDGEPHGLRNSVWYKLLGPGYVEIAFRAAREADPHALLTYNDYGIETDAPEQSRKRAEVLSLLKRMQHEGVPLDAVGIQSHLSAGSDGSAGQIGEGLVAFVEECSEIGLKVFVTELDVNDDSLPEEPAAKRAEQVGAIYGSYLKLLMSNPAVTDVLTWGVNNAASWLNANNAEGVKFRPKHPDREQLCLPFDDSFAPQPAFYALRDAVDVGGPRLR